MHELIDKDMVDTIRTTGKTNKSLPDRIDVLEEYGLPYDRQAENIIISGCQILAALPHVLKSFAGLLDRDNFSYSFLSEEYCCGNYLYRPAIAARDEGAMAECRELSNEFVSKNMEQAKRLGAKRVVIFCSPCYPIYRHSFPDENIVFYPTAIKEVLGPLQFNEKIDYYAGCYKLHRKFSPIPMDLKPVDEIFAKMEGLGVHRISAPKCCFTPEGLSHMTDNVINETMVHVCTGCYGQALGNLPAGKGVDVLMLPQFVEKAMNQ
ncbi:MAG: hypothetical protein JRI85_13215 [Deltaproteobacteria bacterium]|nr:hypothetical protein [Deltaproteobacteria bacterium]